MSGIEEATHTSHHGLTRPSRRKDVSAGSNPHIPTRRPQNNNSVQTN